MQINSYALRRTIIPASSSPDFCQWFPVGSLSDGGGILHLLRVKRKGFGTSNAKKHPPFFLQTTSALQKRTLTYFTT